VKKTITWEDFYGLQRFGMTRGLDNIRKFCERLGHPESAFRAIHVAGTNGKGTVVAILDSVLRAAGLSVGRYTSPHILHFNERIHENGLPIADEAISAFLNDHWTFIEANHCTFFETATAMALQTFSESGVEVGVIEVGLGGTYDATGVVDTILAIMTRIDFDHTDRLGSTLKQIAHDKAGIFRPNVSAVVSCQQPDVIGVLRDRANEIRAKFALSSDLVSFPSYSITPSGIKGDARLTRAVEIQDFYLPLAGSFQLENLQTALAAVCELKSRYSALDAYAVKTGLAQVNWPGRLQVLRTEPTVLLDVGHNPGSLREVYYNITAIWKPVRILTIFSALNDKDVPAMLSVIKANSQTGWVIPLQATRGLTEDELKSLVRASQWEAEFADNAQVALQNAMLAAGSKDVILIIGSHYLAEEVLKNGKYC
jgi:dihydrofolate synthase/folylpolyglutamate synthase